MRKSPAGRESGFTLIEVLLVLGILSILSIIMLYTASSTRRISTANQGIANCQQNTRLITNIIERDLRVAGASLYTDSYRAKNGGQVGELLGSANPDTYDYTLEEVDLEDLMVPPLEVTNGTDDDQQSYLNPLVSTIGLESSYRAYGTDMITIYHGAETSFQGRVDDYTGIGQEHFDVLDEVVGERLLNVWQKLGGKPLLVLVVDDEGAYSTLRTVTDITESSGEYLIKMSPSNSYNQPSNMKAFLESLGYDFTGAGEPEDPEDPTGPAALRAMVTGDNFVQISMCTYFVYSHPDPSLHAQNWLVRLDLAAIAANELSIDASNPDTIRPFVIAERVADFQLALGIDSNDDGTIDGSEWHNSEDMEDYSHVTAGSATTAYIDMVNNLRAVRFSIVTMTDEMGEDDPYGFADRDDPNFYTQYSTVGEVAAKIGITPTLEDRSWSQSELVYSMWYRRAVQLTRVAKVRNLDLENMFARTQ